MKLMRAGWLDGWMGGGGTGQRWTEMGRDGTTMMMVCFSLCLAGCLLWMAVGLDGNERRGKEEITRSM